MPTIKRIIPGLVLAAAAMLVPGQVLADRLPSPEERSSIETLLRDAGFQQWGKIELNEDDDFWDVKDAYASDGSKHDLKLSLETLTIIKGKPDDDELTRRP
jgi:Peptidase propeptide and YPEB domain